MGCETWDWRKVKIALQHEAHEGIIKLIDQLKGKLKLNQYLGLEVFVGHFWASWKGGIAFRRKFYIGNQQQSLCTKTLGYSRFERRCTIIPTLKGKWIA